MKVFINSYQPENQIHFHNPINTKEGKNARTENYFSSHYSNYSKHVVSYTIFTEKYQLTYRKYSLIDSIDRYLQNESMRGNLYERNEREEEE